MKKIIFSLSLMGFFIALIYLSSCSREDSINVNQDRIFTIYELSYSADANSTNARATFRMGGETNSKVKLSEGSSIRFNDQDMNFKSIYAYYEETYTNITDQGTFRFEDLDGNVYSNDVTMNAVEFFDSTENIQKGSAYEIEWDGTPLEAGEIIKITIDGPLDSDDKHFEVSAIGSTSIVLSGTETNTLNAGANIMEMERIYETNSLDAPSVGGKIITTYKATNQALNVVE